MKKIPRKSVIVLARPKKVAGSTFKDVLALIESSRTRAVSAVNTILIDLYWSIGEHISRKISGDGWGKGTVRELAEYIQKREPNARGYSPSNLWRMMQFYETYRGYPKLATLLRVLSWSHNLAILSRSKRHEEREFYLRMASREKWSFRDLQRQLNGALFERTVLSPPKLAPAVRVLHPDAATIFRDSYLVEFLNLSGGHAEADLHRGLSRAMSPAVIAEYQAQLPDKKLLQAKLHEFYQFAQQAALPLRKRPIPHVENRSRNNRRNFMTGTLVAVPLAGSNKEQPVHIIQLLAATDGAVVAGFGGLALLMIVVGLLLSVFWVWMLIDCLLSSMPSGEKLLWFLVIFFTHIIGAVLYYVMVRNGRRTGIV